MSENAIFPCPAPTLLTKPFPNSNDGTLVFYWQDPACGQFYARATNHPDPENAPEESFTILQPTYHTRSVTRSTFREGMLLLGPVYKSVVVEPAAPWTGIELFGPVIPFIVSSVDSDVSYQISKVLSP